MCISILPFRSKLQVKVDLSYCSVSLFLLIAKSHWIHRLSWLFPIVCLFSYHTVDRWPNLKRAFEAQVLKQLMVERGHTQIFLRNYLKTSSRGIPPMRRALASETPK